MYVWVWPGVQVTGCTPFVIIALLSTAHLFLHPLRESLATKTCFRINLLVSDQEYININNISISSVCACVLNVRAQHTHARTHALPSAANFSFLGTKRWATAWATGRLCDIRGADALRFPGKKMDERDSWEVQVDLQLI